MGLTENCHELFEHNSLKKCTIKLDPIHETDVFNAIKGTLDNFVSGDVLVGLMLDSGNNSEVELREHRQYGASLDRANERRV